MCTTAPGGMIGPAQSRRAGSSVLSEPRPLAHWPQLWHHDDCVDASGRPGLHWQLEEAKLWHSQLALGHSAALSCQRLGGASASYCGAVTLDLLCKLGSGQHNLKMLTVQMARCWQLRGLLPRRLCPVPRPAGGHSPERHVHAFPKRSCCSCGTSVR